MRRDGRRQRALELIHGRARLQRRHRFDEIGHRFGLRQVEAPVQERAQREFARLGQPRATGTAELDDAAEQHRAAVRR